VACSGLVPLLKQAGAAKNEFLPERRL
jgi:hypothetical protein